MFCFIFNLRLGVLFPLIEGEEQLTLESINMLNVQCNTDLYGKSLCETGFSKAFAMLMLGNVTYLVILHDREGCGYNVNQSKKNYKIWYKVHNK